ncbi:MAG: sulfur carrier protein ThiS [Pedobacter sp.]|nr:sulfur carrier protein ThiS [Pedobacter sp.]
MQIRLNGEAREVTAATLSALITELELAGKRIAVELNGEIAPRSQHEKISLKAGDHIEIVHAIGGG